MSEAGTTLFYEFADFRVDVEKRLLLKNGEQVSLTPKVFETLLAFLERPGQLLDKETLMDLLWADSFVEESNLTQNVAVLRKALGEDPKQHKYILTIPGRGYRFVAEIRRPDFPDNVDAKPAEGLLVNGAASGYFRSVFRQRNKWLYLIPVILLIVIALVGIWLFGDRFRSQDWVTVERNIQITNWSGLDAYPAISPDGNTIAFCSDRTGSFEIYIHQLVAGSRDIQLTSDNGQNFEPAFSSDGAQIVFHSKKRGGIWIVPVSGGTPRQIAEFGTRPSWSPVGNTIAFQSDSLNDLGSGARNSISPSTIWTVLSNGGELKQITQPNQPPGGHGSPNWSPDGKRIVFDVSDYNISRIWTMSADGTDLKKLVETDSCDGVYDSNGKNIYYVAFRGEALMRQGVRSNGEPAGEAVKIMDSTGGRIRQPAFAGKAHRLVYTSLQTSGNVWTTKPNDVDHPVAITQSLNNRNTLPSFSPDGRRMVFQSAFRVGDVSKLIIADADGKNQTETAIEGFNAHWSSNPSQISFTRRNGTRREIWTAAADGGKGKKLFELDENTADFGLASHDLTKVAFASKKGGATNIFVADLVSGETKQITFDKEFAGFPCWSKDDKWIAFQNKHGEATNIFVVPSGGGDPAQLNDTNDQSWIYDWAPDNDTIVFAGQRDDIWNIYSISRTTRSLHKLTNFNKLNSYVRYPTWSPADGRIAYEYAETRGNIWMIELT